jgi:hypothetical protein
MKCVLKGCKGEMFVSRDYVDSLTGKPMSVWVCPLCSRIELKEAR